MYTIAEKGHKTDIESKKTNAFLLYFYNLYVCAICSFFIYLHDSLNFMVFCSLIRLLLLGLFHLLCILDVWVCLCWIRVFALFQTLVVLRYVCISTVRFGSRKWVGQLRALFLKKHKTDIENTTPTFFFHIFVKNYNLRLCCVSYTCVICFTS